MPVQKKGYKSTSQELKEYKVTNNIEVAPGVNLLSFQRDFDFIPGQVVKVAIDLIHPPRIYSICSGNQFDEVSILFNIKEDGFLTPKMAAMIPGDKIYVSSAYGSFTGTNDEAWLIATGTGIAPFYSMLVSGKFKAKKLIHGVRFLNQFYFEDEMEELLDEKYIRCCSSESACNVFHGRVTNYIESFDYLPDVKYYLCGQAHMVVEVRDLLIKKGIRFENIKSEIYF